MKMTKNVSGAVSDSMTQAVTGSMTRAMTDYLAIYLSIWLSIYLSDYLSIYLSYYLTIYLSDYSVQACFFNIVDMNWLKIVKLMFFIQLSHVHFFGGEQYDFLKLPDNCIVHKGIWRLHAPLFYAV